VTLGIGGALAIGTHTTIDGTTHGGGAPVPLVDLDATFGALGVHGDALPYAKTRSYGNVFAPSTSTLGGFDATVRAILPGNRTAVGVGYGALFTTVSRTNPPGTLTLEARGVRLEALHRLALSPRTTLELGVGGVPLASGSLATATGVVGTTSVTDPVAGSDVDATVRAVSALRPGLAVAYGARYVRQSFAFAHSNATVERNAALLPFVELVLRR
jgi:hypothetical protein